MRRRVKSLQSYSTLQENLLEVAQEEVLALRRAWEIPCGEIRLETRIDGDSPGAFGEVWKGTWEDLTVAVKILQSHVVEMDADVTEEFAKEVEFMQRTRHPNIVRFFGVGTWHTGVPFLVVEYVSRGALKSILRDKQNNPREGIPWEQRVGWALDIARAMEFIHDLGQIHRDLKSGNVLVTGQNRAKVADFGTIRLLQQAPSSSTSKKKAKADVAELEESVGDMTAGKGTPLYMAVEVLRGREYNEKAGKKE